MLQELSASTYTDLNGLNDLKLAARQAPSEALSGIAKQFEGIFLNMVLKSMREASFGDPYFDSSQGEFYQEMFDKQIALTMSDGKGIGLADSLVRQLQQYVPTVSDNDKASLSPESGIIAGTTTTKIIPASFTSKEDFVHAISDDIIRAADELDVDPRGLVAQAALETGWGKHIAKYPGGRSSYNIFNIKADDAWQGKKLTKNTVEVVDGVAKQQQASFRVYDSLQESIQDYVTFIKSNPRYSGALSVSEPDKYVAKLHAAGYATDPGYTNKLTRIIQHDLPEINSSALEVDNNNG